MALQGRARSGVTVCPPCSGAGPRWGLRGSLALGGLPVGAIPERGVSWILGMLFAPGRLSPPAGLVQVAIGEQPGCCVGTARAGLVSRL